MSTIDIPKKVREFAGMAEALSELVELADKANAWHQQEAEHQSRLDALEKQIDAKKAEIDLAKKMEAEAGEKVVAIIEKAKKDGAGIIAKATMDADQIRRQAAELIAVAKAKTEEAAASQAKAEASAQAIMDKILSLGDQLSQARAIITRAETIKKAMG